MVVLRRFPVFSNILAFVVIASLLSLPLANDPIFAPFENVTLEVSFTVNDAGIIEGIFLKSDPELSINADLVPAGKLRLPGDRLPSSAQPVMATLSLKEIISEIFIPPKTVS